MRTRSIVESIGLGSFLSTVACVLPGSIDDDDSSTDSPSSGMDDAGTGGATTGDTANDSVDDTGGADDTGGVDDTGGADDTGGNDSGGPVEPIELVDCFTLDDDPKCVSYPDAGTIGAGPPIYDNDYAEVTAAIVEGSTLLVAVDLGGNTDEFGGLIRIDLPTGDRTWIAGNYQYTYEGEVTMMGAGAEIGSLRGLGRLSDGKYVVFRGGASNSDAGFFEVDLATGDRTEFLLPIEGSTFPCSAEGEFISPYPTIAPGPDGDFWIAGQDSVLLHFTKDKTCEITSRSEGFELPDIGMGPPLGGAPDGLEFHGGQLYALTGFGSPELFVIDPATGDRTLLSSEDAMVGAGPAVGEFSVDVTDDKIWTAGYFDEILPLISVDPVTGDRTLESMSPMAGPIDNGLSDTRPQIFVYGEQILFETNGGGIGVYDPVTKNSNWISM